MDHIYYNVFSINIPYNKIKTNLLKRHKPYDLFKIILFNGRCPVNPDKDCSNYSGPSQKSQWFGIHLCKEALNFYKYCKGPEYSF